MSSEFKKIMQSLQAKQFASVYLIDGEEPFYLDIILNYFENNILQPSERDFNLIVLYAKDTESRDIINACRRFPMFCEKQIVILKDASQLRSLSDLEDYISKPTPSTIFLIEHRFKKVDGRSKLPKLVKEKGVYFTSDKLKDEREVQQWIQNYGNEHNFRIGEQEAELLAVHLGNDLQKISNEIDKVRINVPLEKELTRELIHKYIGISREYNVLDFPDILLKDDRDKVYKMLSYFFANPKSAPIPLLIGTLYSKLSTLYQLNFIKGKSDKDIAAAMGISPYSLKYSLPVLPKWPLPRVEKCLILLSKYSGMAVGIDTYTTEDCELLKELIGQMME